MRYRLSTSLKENTNCYLCHGPLLSGDELTSSFAVIKKPGFLTGRLRRNLCNWLVFLQICLPALFPAEVHATFETAIQKIEILNLNGDRRKAISKVHSLYEANPDNEKIFLLFAELTSGSYPFYAGKLFEAAGKLSKSGNLFAANIGFCKYFRIKNDFSTAEEKCKKALFIKPLQADTYREMAFINQETGNSKKAEENFRHYISLSTSNYKGYFLLAEEYAAGKKRGKALFYYKKALRLLPNYAQKTSFARVLRKKIKKLKARKKRKKSVGDIGKCLSRAEKLDAEYKLEKAHLQIKKCLKINPVNRDVRLLYSSILIHLGKYEKAIAEYQKTVKMDFPPAIKAFCHIKTAETYAKMKKQKQALDFYKKAISINPSDTNALRGMAATYEILGKPQKALECYIKLLKLEPANPDFEKKADSLETATMSDNDMLAELRLRKSILPGVSKITRKHKEILKFMKEAEEHGAINFLKTKGFYLPPLTLKVNKKWGKLKIILNARGFKIYRKYFSQEIIKFFEKKRISLKEIFALRDRKGNPFFEKDGFVTYDGFRAYFSALKGNKSWLMPYENAERSEKDPEYAKKAEKLIKNGYREIYEPEFLYLLRATDCPEDVLKPPQETYLQTFTTQKGKYYFLCYEPNSFCSPVGDSKTILFGAYIERYRRGDDTVPEFKRSTAFFGLGSVENARFCKDGKIWSGD